MTAACTMAMEFILVTPVIPAPTVPPAPPPACPPPACPPPCPPPCPPTIAPATSFLELMLWPGQSWVDKVVDKVVDRQVVVRVVVRVVRVVPWEPVLQASQE